MYSCKGNRRLLQMLHQEGYRPPCQPSFTSFAIFSHSPSATSVPCFRRILGTTRVRVRGCRLCSPCVPAVLHGGSVCRETFVRIAKSRALPRALKSAGVQEAARFSGRGDDQRTKSIFFPRSQIDQEVDFDRENEIERYPNFLLDREIREQHLPRKFRRSR